VNDVVTFHLLVKLLGEQSTCSFITTTEKALSDFSFVHSVNFSLLINLLINFFEFRLALQLSLSTSALFTRLELLLHFVKFLYLLLFKLFINSTLGFLVSRQNIVELALIVSILKFVLVIAHLILFLEDIVAV